MGLVQVCNWASLLICWIKDVLEQRILDLCNPLMGGPDNKIKVTTKILPISTICTFWCFAATAWRLYNSKNDVKRLLVCRCRCVWLYNLAQPPRSQLEGLDVLSWFSIQFSEKVVLVLLISMLFILIVDIVIITILLIILTAIKNWKRIFKKIKQDNKQVR